METGGTVIARGVKVEGDFSSQGDVVIDGEVSGSLSASGTLRIGSEAVIKADVEAGEAVIAGRVDGSVTILRRLDVMTSGQIKGDIKAETISVEAGAVLNGAMSVGGRTSVPSSEENKAEPETET